MKDLPMLLLLIVCRIAVIYAQGAETIQASALLAFKNTTVDPRGGLNNWLPDNAPCAFSGVTCTINDSGSGAAQILTRLNLTGLNLTGTISPELSKLQSLQALDLSNNAFSGPLPETLGTLPELSLLDVRNNQLNGTVPTTLIRQGLELRADGNPALQGLPLATPSPLLPGGVTQAPGVIVPRGAADSSSEVGPSSYQVYVVAVSVPLVVAFLVIAAAVVAVWRRRRKLAPSSQPLAMSAMTNGSNWSSKPTPLDSRTEV